MPEKSSEEEIIDWKHYRGVTKAMKPRNRDEANYMSTSPIATDPVTNPCLKEENLTRKCMYQNNHDSGRCITAFQNYKLCQSFWDEIKMERFWRGERPLLPLPEDRETIKRNKIQEKIAVFKKSQKN